MLPRAKEEKISEELPRGNGRGNDNQVYEANDDYKQTTEESLRSICFGSILFIRWWLSSRRLENVYSIMKQTKPKQNAYYTVVSLYVSS